MLEFTQCHSVHICDVELFLLIVILWVQVSSVIITSIDIKVMPHFHALGPNRELSKLLTQIEGKIAQPIRGKSCILW